MQQLQAADEEGMQKAEEAGEGTADLLGRVSAALSRVDSPAVPWG